jgi:integrase
VGVENVHPHAFRRSFATLRIKNGQSTRGVQRLGRWKNLATFERYTQVLMIDDDFARDEAANYSLRRWCINQKVGTICLLGVKSYATL